MTSYLGNLNLYAKCWETTEESHTTEELHTTEESHSTEESE